MISDETRREAELLIHQTIKVLKRLDQDMAKATAEEKDVLLSVYKTFLASSLVAADIAGGEEGLSQRMGAIFCGIKPDMSSRH